jgi:hypothetical protein
MNWDKLTGRFMVVAGMALAAGSGSLSLGWQALPRDVAGLFSDF